MMTNPPEQEADMLTDPYPDYLLPKRLRHLLWILGCLIFYGQFTSIALSRVAMDPQLGTHVFSGWTALAYLEWNAPAKIFIPDASELSSYAVQALWVAGFGSLAMFVAASVRRGRFTGLVLSVTSCRGYFTPSCSSSCCASWWHRSLRLFLNRRQRKAVRTSERY
jgi:hypothetical protein